MLSIRLATEADAAALADLHVRAWQWAYRGQLPDEFLDGLTEGIPRREAWRRQTLADPATEARTWVAGSEGQVMGFADTAPTRDQDAQPGTAELFTIYLEPNVVGTGAGRALMQHAVADLKRRGFQGVTLWVLETNARARRFYELGGWRLDGATKVEKLGETQLREVRYRIDLSRA